MSRYDLNPRDPELRVTVGWDPPLQTYFAQVFRDAPPESDDDDEEILWRGFGRAMGDEIVSVDTIRSLIAPWADLPGQVEKQLLLDKGRDTR